MKWITKMRSSLGKRLNRVREKCPSLKSIKKVGKEVGKEAIETVEIEVEDMVHATKKTVRWPRHNPIKTVLGIVAAIFCLK